MTSASYFWDLWESKSILKIPIMSLAPSVPKHSILIKEWWRQRQMSQDRRTASHQSYYLHRSECFEATHHIWTPAISRNVCILQRQLMVCARLYALTYLCSDQGGADYETQCDVFVLFFFRLCISCASLMH